MKTYKSGLLVISLLLLSYVSCDNSGMDENLVCNVENPLEDLQWLAQIKQTIEMNMGMAGAQIIQYKYKGNYVFWIDMCYHCPDAIITVQNCAGEVICEFGGIDGRNTCIDFATEATDSTMLFDNVQH